jgi:hypothetical protein
VLTLPPLLMEKYVRAAEEISQKAILAPAPGPVFESPRKMAQFKADSGGSFDGTRFTFSSNGKITFDEQAPWTGKYSLEMGMAGSAAEGQYPKLVVSVDGKKVYEVTVETESADRPASFSIPLRLRNGKRTIELAFVNDKYIEAKNGAQAQDTNLFIYDVKMMGQKASEPVVESELPAFHKEMVKDAVPSASRSVRDAASEVVRKIASRAYRRPVTEDELRRLAGLVADVVEEGDTYEAGLQTAVTAILVSPHFLFKIEDNSAKVGQEFPLLTEFELATRLSYFLWSSTPDRELLSLAAKNQLRQPEVIRQQIQRMIRDERARDFVRNFAGQWLTLRKLDSFVPSETVFPEWNEEIRDLAKTETFLLFLYVMRENLSILRLLDADYSFMNQKLASFYGVPGVQGDKFQKVSLKGQKRLGLLTHASILAVTSNPTRTSPVKRGVWVLEQVLGEHVPPPPPNVPPLEKQDKQAVENLTLRQRTELHRTNAVCANCHKILDPIGFGLENFDATGRWRDQDDTGRAIDAAGELPGEKRFSSPRELKAIIAARKDELAQNLTRKLLAYALCRQLEGYDEIVVDQLMETIAKDGYRMQTLISEIVTSYPFVNRRILEIKASSNDP